ncbi:MAG: hypothetical protein IH840_10560 [Candidatus Heimdallarchaeota archaeon]|nr:hypothetical protein [Candidatus Heimdallarchaeota archaeon]
MDQVVAIRKKPKLAEIVLLAGLIAFDLIIQLTKPVQGATYNYLSLIVLLTVAWVYYNLNYITSYNFFKNSYLRLWILFLLVRQILILIFLDVDSELVYVYQTLFEALEDGVNPYEESVIYHRLSDESTTLERFNYPPGEILFYWIGYKILGFWNYGVILLVNLIVNVLAIFLIHIKTKHFPLDQKLLYFVFLIIINLHNSVSTTFLAITIVGLLLFDLEQLDQSKPRRILLVFIFSFGLLSKFYLIPVVGLYYWYRIVEKRQFEYLIYGFANLLLVLALILPFGIYTVIDSTILFNLDLDVRGELTSYYPNPLSILFYLVDLKSAYAVTSVIIMFTAVLSTRNIELLDRLVVILSLSLLIFPTPEDQYFGSLIVLLFLVKIRDKCRFNE